MKLVLLALRRPVTILVAVLAVAASAWLAIRRMPADIFPNMGSPTIYVAQPYGGMDPQQMEGFLTYYYEYHFLYITGIERVESKNVQGAALMKLVFHPGTDMSQAMGEVVGYVNRSRAFMPPGAVPPFITRFDAGGVAIGQLIFSSPTRPVGEMQNIALNDVRPLFATLPGVSAPPPFGGNQRTIVVRLNPERLSAYSISPEEAITAVNRATLVMPAGNVRTGDLIRIASSNATLGGNLQELLATPVRDGIYLRDIATIESSTDIVTAYAHVDGKRTVYIPVTKRADASTLDVIRLVREALPRMKGVVPDDVDIRLEFDQSRFVAGAIRNLVNEGVLGALLTGLMVLLFLRDWRSALIVVATIPAALLSAAVWLWATGQTINIMTLGGLALAVGVLVDEATVEIENIHSHMGAGVSKARAVVEACSQTAIPRLLSMLCVLAVFVPSFFMAGVARQLFVPLSLAVGFAMISSYVLSSTLVPVLSIWLMKTAREHEAEGLRNAYARLLPLNPLAGVAYLVVCGVVLWLAFPRIGREIFPESDAGLVQFRLRAPVGTRIERTELVALKALDIVKQTTDVDITTSFIGAQPPSYPINLIHLFTSGPHEIVFTAALKPSATLRGEPLREKLREKFAAALPGVAVSFEPADIIGKVMAFGSPTPIEVAVQGPSVPNNRAFAAKVQTELAKLAFLRDLQYGQPLDYPTVQVTIDRDRAGQLGLTMAGVARSLTAATSSSRLTDPNFWRDPVSGNGFQVQVEIPQQKMQTIEDLRALPVSGSHAQLGDLADIRFGSAPGEVDRYNMQRVVSLTANVHDRVLSDAARGIRDAIARAGTPPKGVHVNLRGQIPPLDETVTGLSQGLALAAGVVFLLLTANFQSFRLALAVILVAPGALAGVALMLLATGTTLNVQSFMGAIMAIGISVANAILLVTFAERHRQQGDTTSTAAREGARSRLRAILMTAIAMIAGMIPMALGLGETGAQTAPLGRAVIGGLLGATVATLFALPSLYTLLQKGSSRGSASLDPNDPESRFHEPAA